MDSSYWDHTIKYDFTRNTTYGRTVPGGDILTDVNGILQVLHLGFLVGEDHLKAQGAVNSLTLIKNKRDTGKSQYENSEN